LREDLVLGVDGCLHTQTESTHVVCRNDRSSFSEIDADRQASGHRRVYR
jgi:hypothetical protein